MVGRLLVEPVNKGHRRKKHGPKWSSKYLGDNIGTPRRAAIASQDPKSERTRDREEQGCPDCDRERPRERHRARELPPPDLLRPSIGEVTRQELQPSLRTMRAVVQAREGITPGIHSRHQPIEQMPLDSILPLEAD